MIHTLTPSVRDVPSDCRHIEAANARPFGRGPRAAPRRRRSSRPPPGCTVSPTHARPAPPTHTPGRARPAPPTHTSGRARPRPDHGPPLRRLLWTLQRLRTGRPIRATDLASHFEVSVRTAYRDLDFLRDDWRVPLEYDHHKGTYWLTEPVAAPTPGQPQPRRARRHLLRREGPAPVPRHPLRARPRQRLQEDPGAAAGGAKVSPESLD
jgi:hypothetical protein